MIYHIISCYCILLSILSKFWACLRVPGWGVRVDHDHTETFRAPGHLRPWLWCASGVLNWEAMARRGCGFAARLEKQGRRLERFWVGKVAEALYDLFIYIYIHVYTCGICEAFLSWFSEVVSIMYQYHSEEMRHVHTLSGPTELCHMQVAS